MSPPAVGRAPDAPEEPADAGYVAALAGMDQMGPRRLRALLAHHPPAEAYAVVAGRHRPHPVVEPLLRGRVGSAWRALATPELPGQAEERCRALGVRVLHVMQPEFPALLRCDPLPPAALFVRGDLGALDGRRVAVIGTRNATRGGLETATALGRDLATSGVAVISGLARGIDGAAHRGALAALAARATDQRAEPTTGPPVAVVGNGLDRPYPRQHGGLWEQVAGAGLLMSEWPPGVRPDAFRFPMRNRLIAALAEVLVVVESREAGGSLSTVREAVERSVTVMAVPGSPRCRAAAGTNRLLCEGAAPATCSDDVLVALGLDTRRRGPAFDPRPRPSAVEQQVLAQCRAGPCTLDDVVVRCGLDVSEAAMALARLERAGWVADTGGWFEAAGPWSMVP